MWCVARVTCLVGIIRPSRHMWDTFFVLKGESWTFPAG